jgi:hypothetical protein
MREDSTEGEGEKKAFCRQTSRYLGDGQTEDGLSWSTWQFERGTLLRGSKRNGCGGGSGDGGEGDVNNDSNQDGDGDSNDADPDSLRTPPKSIQ